MGCKLHDNGTFHTVILGIFWSLHFGMYINCIDAMRETCDISEDHRIIRALTSSIDTKSTPAFAPNKENCQNPQSIHQFYIQTIASLGYKEKSALEKSIGVVLDRYVPNDAYVVGMNCSQVTKALTESEVLWVGLRPLEHKLDPSLFEEDISGSATQIATLFVELMPCAASGSAPEAAKKFQLQVQQEAKIQSSFRVVSASKLAVDVPATDIVPISRWMAAQAEVTWLEPKMRFAARNSAAGRIIVSGISSYSKSSSLVYTQQYGLNGAGQVIGLADTGLDWDHCMLWNLPFPFPCYDAQLTGLYDEAAFVPHPTCGPSAFAGFLANPDFLAFVESKMNTNTTLDSPLLNAGTTAGVKSTYAPLDVAYPNRAVRSQLGLVFLPGSDATFPSFLRAWTVLRPKLLNVLQQLQDPAECTNCGGTIVDEQGVPVFEPFKTYKYTWAVSDQTGPKLWQQSKQEFLNLSKLLFQKCMCFFTTPSNATVDMNLPWMGPVPPILDLLDLAYSPYAQVTRKFLGLPALPADLLQNMCNISKQKHIDLCSANITFDWGGSEQRLEPCTMTWDPRILEAAVASCTSEVFMPKTVLPERSFSTASSVVRTQYYVYNTTVSWWGEYTRVPPFNRVDKSRVSVISYYTNDGCDACGLCNQVIVDTRNYAGAEITPSSPANLAKGTLFLLKIKPIETDWRSDKFQFRNMQLSLQLFINGRFQSSTPFPPNATNTTGLTICVMTVQDIDFDWNVSSAWLSRCLFVQKIQPTSKVASTIDTQSKNITIALLEQTSLGWQILIVHNESYSVLLDAFAQIAPAGKQCSDKKDGESLGLQNSHTSNLTNTDIASLDENNTCVPDQVPYCDNSFNSGRQLDLCTVCGGICFPPSCNQLQCAGTNGIVAIRFAGEIQSNNGLVERKFQFPQRLAASAACSQRSIPGVTCRPDNCNVLLGCFGRIETYKIDTRAVTVRAGEPFIFGAGSLILDSSVSPLYQRVNLNISLFWPSLNGQTPPPSEMLGILKLPPALFMSNSTTTVNVSGTYVNAYSDNTIQIIGNINDIFLMIMNLSYTADVAAGANLKSRQTAIRFQLSILAVNDRHFSRPLGLISPYMGICTDVACPCLNGFTGDMCDIMPNPTEIVFTIQPQDVGQTVISSTSGSVSGRSGLLSRGGHGTHTAISMVGVATTEPSDINNPDISEIQGYETPSNGAQLSFLDIGTDSNPDLMPPESFGDGLLGRTYTEGGGRVFVAPWNCEDFAWWQDQTVQQSAASQNASSMVSSQYSDDSNTVPYSPRLWSQPSICNRYSTSAWEIDEYVQGHPDLLVIFPAGDGGQKGSETISSPGTCKNCLTVGNSQMWADSLQEASKFVLESCRPDDCPQYADQSPSCGGVNQTSPYSTPDCCKYKYTSDYYDPGRVHFSSSSGFGISHQSSQKPYTAVQETIFRRIKPEIVAPGTLIVSGRSDGDPDSGGTNGCRCCSSNQLNSCLVSLTGSSMSAAQVGAVAVMVRQYFTDGWYPKGYTVDVADGFNPSASLMKALLITSADAMSSVALPSGKAYDLKQVTPNLFSGFGRVDLMNVLRISLPIIQVCECSGDNSALFSDKNDPNKVNLQIFGEDYGKHCAPWNNMAGRRCDSMFLNTEIKRPAPGGFNPDQVDISCCFSFCFVSSSCNVENSGNIVWKSVPELSYSFVTCPNQDLSILQNCPWIDPSRNYNVQTIVKDHSVLDFSSAPSASIPYTPTFDGIQLQSSDAPQAGVISQNETVLYNGTIFGASTNVPFIVTLAYTDPVGSLGSADVLVNDLNLRVLFTPLSTTLSPNMSMNQAAALPRSRDQVVQLWGNGITNGDPYNNVEQVRISQSGSAEIVIFVEAKRVIKGLTTSEPCQTFSLVWTGQLFGFPQVMSFSTIPPTLKGGICGRPSALPQPESALFSPLILGLVIAGSLLGAILLIAVCYWLAQLRAQAKQGSTDNKSMPDQLGYLTRINEVKREDGIARGGAMDHILLSMDASDETDFYKGFPIAITSGHGAGEVSVIVGYEGSLRKASVRFKNACPAKGSKYIITHEHGTGMGYKVGALGYVPPPEQARRSDGFQNPFYSRQVAALSHSRSTYGELSENQLAAAGIGKGQPTRSHAQDMNALNAGMYVGRTFTSKEMFDYSIKQAEKDANEYDPIAELRKRERQEYFDTVAAATKTDHDQGTYLRGANGTKLEVAPVLKRNVLPSGLVKLADPNGFRFMSQSREPKGEIAVTEEELHV